MKISQFLLVYLALMFSSSAYSYVSCSNVTVQLRSASTASYHKFNEVGITGNSVFVGIPASKCNDSSGNVLSNSIYLVLDDIDNAGKLKSLWVSMLLTASAGGKTISFSSNSLGVNSNGFQVLKPYHLSLN